MIAQHATQEHPATSLARFFASHAEAYHRMANAPIDATNSDLREELDRETRELHEMHLSGSTINACAKRAGITNAAMSGRFRRRGLEVVYHAGGRQQ